MDKALAAFFTGAFLALLAGVAYGKYIQTKEMEQLHEDPFAGKSGR